MRVSVIMGIYNCAATLPAALDSIAAQTFTDWELILCDDGSDDGTYDIAVGYRDRDPERIRLLRNEKNLGLNATLNRCLAEARGEYIARMDGDDLCSSDRFEKEVDALDRHPEVAVVSCGMALFDENGVWGSVRHPGQPQKKDFIKGSPFCHAPCMMRRAALEAVGGYSEADRLLRVEDYHLWVKLYAAGYRGMNLPEDLYQMRDDRGAQGRRRYRYRVNEAYVRLFAVRALELPAYNAVWAAVPLIVGLMPPGLYRAVHRKRLGG